MSMTLRWRAFGTWSRVRIDLKDVLEFLLATQPKRMGLRGE